MLVDSVLFDSELSLAARALYAAMARWVGKDNNICSKGHRLIARILGVSKNTIGPLLKELAARKHIVVIGSGSDRRHYILTSNRFKAKATVSAPRQKSGFDGVVSKAHLSAPCGESTEPIMRSPEEMEARKQRRLAKKSAA